MRDVSYEMTLMDLVDLSRAESAGEAAYFASEVASIVFETPQLELYAAREFGSRNFSRVESLRLCKEFLQNERVARGWPTSE